MKYTLKDNNRGYIEDRQSVFCDTRGEAELPVFLPENVDVEGHELIARIVDGRGKEHDLRLEPSRENGLEYSLKLPNYLMKPQLLQVTVCLCADGKAYRYWVCDPLRICDLGAQLSVVRYLDSAKCEETEKNVTELQLQLAGIEERLKTNEETVHMQKQAIETQRELIHTLSGTVRELIRQVGLIEADYSIVDTIREEEA